MTITCPHCKEKHGLFWVRWADNTKHLSFRCNKVQYIQNLNNPNKSPRLTHHSQQFQVEDEAVIATARKLRNKIPEVWNKRLARKRQEESQMNLI